MRLLIPISAGLLMLAGCSRETPATVSTISNTDLEQMVKSRLAADSQLATNVNVSADANKNEVTLSGTLDSETLRTEAVEMAKNSHAGISVIDKIDVKPKEVARADYTEDMARDAREKAKVVGDKLGTSLDDAWLHTKISAKLVGNADTPATKINVDVVNGVVTLRGVVDSSTAKSEAQRVAENTDGVKRVLNRLTVRGV
jgi:hyperosmotically inducible periplasmic protein